MNTDKLIYLFTMIPRQIARIVEIAEHPVTVLSEPLEQPIVTTGDFIAASGKFPSDARCLAEWAITGFELEPERWERRINYAKSIASQILDHHKKQIIRLATLLFERGTLTAAEIPNGLVAHSQGAE